MTWEAARKQIPCPYYARGTCKYGEHCQLKHGNDNEDEEEGNLMNTTTTASGQQQQTSSACAAVVTTEANDDSNTCGICLEDVVESGHKKFGLLSCCRHTFCLDCLMEWRKEGSQEAEDRRSCPTCRKHSDYVVPSSRFPANEQEKHRMVTEYKDRLAVIPCKHFNGVLGSCPFGRDCFYAHFNDEGENVKAQDQTMKELVEQKAARSRSRYRHRHGSGGSSGGDDMDMLLSFLRLLDMYGYQRDIYWSDSDDDDSDGED
jgi:E3 ubiquitin-protein ligase makorin